MKYDWYLFDLDGTLTESDEGIINSARDAMRRMGVKSPSDADMRKFIGPPLMWSFQAIAGMTEDEARQAVKLYRERFGDIGWKENKVYPGIAPLLRGIKRRGGHVALASAKPEMFSLKILEYFGLMPYFDAVSAARPDEDSPKKDTIIRRALPEDVDLSRVVMVGDRKYDVEGARQVGVDAVAVAYGYGEASEFAGAVAVADTTDELWDILIGGPKDRGCFVTFEGGDGCGKSTQFKLAVDYFTRRGWDVVASREPGGCPVAEKIRDILLDIRSKGMTAKCEAMLYAAARAQHVHDVILPALEGGKLMLCDRFLDSSIAYQAYGRELTEDFIRQINAPAVGDLQPDMTLLYTVDTDTARERVMEGGAPDRMESEGDDFVARLNAGYAMLAQRESARIHALDGSRTIEEVFADTSRHIAGLLI